MKCKLTNKDIRQNYVVELLRERGLDNEEIRYFLDVPDASHLQSPNDLDHIEEAKLMFDDMKQLNENHRIMVCVDSDVDGFTSAAIFIQYLRKFNTKVQIDYILHKGKGHGLSDTIDDILLSQEDYPNIKYVILPDSGK